MAAMLAFISCDEIGNLTGDKENGKDENSSIIEDSGLDKGPTKELEPSAQKVKLENVAEALMDEYPASGFEDFFLLADRFSKTYFEDILSLSRNPFFPVNKKISSNVSSGYGYWAGYGSVYYKISISDSLSVH